MNKQIRDVFVAGLDSTLIRVEGCSPVVSYIQQTPVITPLSLLAVLQELQRVKCAEPKGFDLEQECANARERLRVSIEANAAYSLKQFEKAGYVAALELKIRHNVHGVVALDDSGRIPQGLLKWIK